MLVLTRHPNQSIMIGSDVVITVLEVRGDQVRIGIKAPRDIEVHREEVWAQLRKANQAAATPSNVAIETLGGVKKPSIGDKKPTVPSSQPETSVDLDKSSSSGKPDPSSKN